MAEIREKYRPWLDFDNLPFFKDGGGFQNSIIFIAIRFIILIIVWHKPLLWNSGVNQIGTGKSV